MLLRGEAAMRVPSGKIHHPSIIPYNSDGSNIFRGVCAWHPGAQKNVLASTKHRLLFREPTSLKYISKLCRVESEHARTCKHTHTHRRARTQVSDLSLTCFLRNLQKGEKKTTASTGMLVAQNQYTNTCWSLIWSNMYTLHIYSRLPQAIQIKSVQSSAQLQITI